MSYMRSVKVHIGKTHPLSAYMDQLTSLANNLANAALFRERQVMTAVSKPEDAWTENERTVMDEVRDTQFLLASDWQLPCEGKSVLFYNCLDDIMKTTGNPDYFAKGLPRQSAQHVLKQTVRDMVSFYQACRVFKENPSAFTGRPQLPKYKKKGGHTTVHITNQDCTLKEGPDGKWYVGFPFKKDTHLCIGMPVPDARLKEVTITLENGRYSCSFKFEVCRELPEITGEPQRICAIDFGVNNLMAVVNNCGLAPVLYKGSVLKSVNQYYNKRIASIVSEQTLATGKKFVPTEGYYAVTNKRNDQINDCIKKYAKHFITWCVENRIDTVVMGVNRLWKQEVDLGHENNQEFVQLPSFKLQETVRYLCAWNGIRCVEQEESYTSKASFLDMDDIPIYGCTDPEIPPAFSGRRRPCWHKGQHKKDGFRGLYVSADGTVINSDLNGSSNILRKAFPAAFSSGETPDFSKTLVVRHPELEPRRVNRAKQLVTDRIPSRAKQKRERRKQNQSLSAAV